MQREIFKIGNDDPKKIIHREILNKKQHFLNCNKSSE